MAEVCSELLRLAEFWNSCELNSTCKCELTSSISRKIESKWALLFSFATTTCQPWTSGSRAIADETVSVVHERPVAALLTFGRI